MLASSWCRKSHPSRILLKKKWEQAFCYSLVRSSRLNQIHPTKRWGQALLHLVFHLLHNLNKRVHYLADRCFTSWSRMFADCNFTTDKKTVLVLYSWASKCILWFDYCCRMIDYNFDYSCFARVLF